MVDVLADVATFAAQPEWSLVRPMPVVTLQVRKAVGFLLLMPAGTMFLLYLFRPRPYVLSGVVSWLAVSAMMLALSFDTGANTLDSPDQLVTGPLGMALWAISALGFGASLRFAAVWFRAPTRIPAFVTWILVATSVVVAIAIATRRPAAALIPTFIVMSLLQARAALVYFQIARRHRFVGAYLAGGGVAALLAVNGLAAVIAIRSQGVSEEAISVVFFNFGSIVLMALGMHLLIFEDVIEELRTAGAALSASRDEMRAMAVTDPLTGCYNRRFLDDIATHELEQHRRYNLPLALLYIDIDHFKAINDANGHHTGDRVLQTLGTILHAHTRHADYVLRWGGDEFLILMSADAASAAAKAQDIRQAFLESAIVRDLPDGVDLSIGCVAVPPDTEHFAPLIDQADREMYRRKRALAG